MNSRGFEPGVVLACSLLHCSCLPPTRRRGSFLRPGQKILESPQLQLDYSILFPTSILHDYHHYFISIYYFPGSAHLPGVSVVISLSSLPCNTIRYPDKMQRALASASRGSALSSSSFSRLPRLNLQQQRFAHKVGAIRSSRSSCSVSGNVANPRIGAQVRRGG